MTRALDAASVLALSETGAGRQPLDRALLLLWADDGDDAADLPLADRDRRLLELRRATFGDRLDLRADCPECGAELELALAASDLAASLHATGPETVGPLTLRDLTSRDLAALATAAPERIDSLLRTRLTGSDNFPAPLAAKIDARIEARAAAAEIAVALTCAACGAAWRDTLDVAAHLWAEIDAAAHRAAAEVAELARAYGWSEADILAMPPARRARYFDLARAG